MQNTYHLTSHMHTVLIRPSKNKKTGSGKTLSLLCSALAWQQREKHRIEEGLAQYNAQLQAHLASLETQSTLDAAPAATPIDVVPLLKAQTETELLQTTNDVKPPPPPPPQKEEEDTSPDSSFCIELDKGGDITTPTTNPSHHTTAIHATTTTTHHTHHTPGAAGFLPPHHPDAPPPDTPLPRQKPQKIFYATRTHSQIAQVVRELKRSGFSPRMAVLGSKQHYCVNPHARDKSSLEEACEELLKESQCGYFKGVGAMLHSAVTRQVHDIEDLCKAGKRQKGCPYYISRKLSEDAELIFGPYNYFVDPVIRRSMGVDVEGAIVIFDEAHNIEDVSREAASLDLERMTAMETHGALVRASQYNGRPEIYDPLKEMMAAVLRWMEVKEKEAVAAEDSRRQQVQQQRGRWVEPYERICGGRQMMDELTVMGLTPDAVQPLWDAYTAARTEDEAMANGGGGGGGAPGAAAGSPNKGGNTKGTPTAAGSATKAVRVGAGALGVLSRLIQILRLLHEASDDGGRDFRLVVKRVLISSVTNGAGGGRGALRAPRLLVASGDGNGTSPATQQQLPDHFLTLSLWCLNPAVAFRQVAQPAHSIILTSGTLSPLDSFASELGSPFEIRLEAPHVVNMATQVWAGAIGTGPNNEQLIATYQHTDKPTFHDAVGSTVLYACRTIPDGVLLFLPSYSLLDKLAARWKVTGLWSRLAQMKTVVQEPRIGGADALQAVMTAYYSAISAGRGGLFLAVCRGKVSEGLDFADANARGVIVVGIPFPNFKDSKVEAKRKFNDAGARTLGLLPGSTWYEQQAFRALNQAVGRCIRHRGDWGAIILIDERFQQAKYQRGLSRWVRGAIMAHPSFQAATASMESFFARLKMDPPVAPLKIAPAAVEEDSADVIDLTNDDEPKVNALTMLMAGHKPAAATMKKEKEMSEKQRKEEAEERNILAAAVVVQPAQQQEYHQQTPQPCMNTTTGTATATHSSVLEIVRRAPLLHTIPTELSMWAEFAKAQGAVSTDGEARALAASGILDAFNLALEAVSQPVPVHTWLCSIHLPPPFGVQAVLSTVPHQLPPGTVLHVQASTFGAMNLTHIPVRVAIEAMKEAYVEVLNSIESQYNKSNGGGGGDGGGQKRKWEVEQQQHRVTMMAPPHPGGAFEQQPQQQQMPGAAAARQRVFEAQAALRASASDGSDGF